MEMRRASLVFPLAIRARLSTEDSASDYSSSLDGDSDSDYNSGIGVAEEEEEEGSYETSEDDATFLGRPSMPKARITGDDEDDDILEDAFFDDDDGSVGGGEKEENIKVKVEESEVKSSNGGDCEGFSGGFITGRGENGLFTENDKNDDTLGAEGPVIASLELQQQVNENDHFGKAEAMPVSYDPSGNEGGLELDDVKLKMADTDVVEVVVEEALDSIVAVYEKTGAVSSGDVEQSNDFSLKFKDLVVESSNMDTEKFNLSSDIEELGVGFISGREENGFSDGSNETYDNLCHVNTSSEELQLQVKESGYSKKAELVPAFDDDFANGGGLVLNDVKREMDVNNVADVVIEEFLDSITAGYDQVGAVSSGDGEQSNDFFLALKDWEVEFCNIDTEKNNLSGDIKATPKSAMEVEMSDLEFEAQDGYLGIQEAEENLEEIVKIGDVGIDISNQYWNEEMRPKTEKAEFLVREVMQEEASQAESDFIEFKGFEATNAVDFIHRKSLELVSLFNTKAFEPKSPGICADDMETEEENYFYDNTYSMNSEKAKDSTGKLLSLTGYEDVHESYSHIKETCAENIVAYHTQFLDNFKEKPDESRAIFTQVSMTENYNACEYSFLEHSSFSSSKKKSESRLDLFHFAHDEGLEEEDVGLISEWLQRGATLEKSEIVKNILKVLEEGSSGSHLDFKGSLNHSQILGGQIISGSDKKVEIEEDGSAKELFDTSILAALLKASSGVCDLTSQDTSSIFSIKHLVGFRSVTSILKPINFPFYSSCIRASSDPKFAVMSGNITNDEEKMLLLKVDQVRLKYLRLVQRLGHFADDDLPSHVLYWLGLVDGVSEARKIREEFNLEDKFKDDFAFSCNILVLGKTGAGKSAAINSIFREERASIDHFHPATTSVREISGVVDGVYVSVIDTPGLFTSLYDQGKNRKILSSIKKYTTRRPPDVVLYVDRLDAHTRDLDDLHLLRMITNILGSSIWRNSIIALTHAATAFSDGPDGYPLSYELVVAQRSHAVQQSIRQAVGDMHLTNPVALMENHPSCSKNVDGESMLPDGLKWRPWLLLLCYSSKILSEVNSILKFEIPSPQNLSSSHHSYPFPADLSTLLQSKVHPKPSGIQGDDNYDSEIDSDCMTNEVSEEDDEYDQLPPIKTLKRSQVQKLINEQKNVYFGKYNCQLKLLQKKQLKDELIRLKKLEQGRKDPDVSATIAEGFEQEVNPSVVPIPIPNMVSSSPFDSENSTYHYHFLEPKSQLLTRPVICNNYCDFDSCYGGVIIKESIDIASQFPMSLAVQITKGKKEFNIYLGSSIASKHGENGSSFTIFDIQPVGNQLAYTFQGDTKLSCLKKIKTAAGSLITFSGKTSANGFKLEDLIFPRNMLPFIASIDMLRAESGVTYGANLEVSLREKYSSKKRPSRFGSSMIKWADFTVGANLQFSAGQNSRMSVRVGLNNRNTGQISIITNSTKQAHIVLLGLFTIVFSMCRSICSSKTN